MKKDREEKIDFVILWVDGNDKEWLQEKNKYLGIKGDSNINRFRDSDNLQYLFRGIEKYAPWVNKIFFVTWGHLPKWIDKNNEKLVIVNHKDFIPNQYLPTFNSNVIEDNLFRINKLSSKFVLLNDDIFILKKLKPINFFKKGLPRDMFIEYIKENPSKRHKIMRENYNSILNNYFSKREFYNKNFSKVFNIRYGINNLKTLKMASNTDFGDIYSQHLSQPFLKEIFVEVWDKEKEKLDKACYNKFRADSDIGNCIFRYWQLLTAKFYPSRKIGKYFIMSDNNKKLICAIKMRKYKLICVNDANINIDFEKSKNEINTAFERIFPNKSSFEI